MNAFVFIEPFPPQVSWISPRFFYASTVGYHPAVPVDESSWYLDLGHPWYHAKFDIFRVWECLEEKMGKLPENVLPKIMQTAYSILPPPSLAYWRNTSLWVCMGWYHWDEKLRQYSFIVTDGVSVSLTSLFPIASLPPHPTPPWREKNREMGVPLMGGVTRGGVCCVKIESVVCGVVSHTSHVPMFL